MTILLNSLKMDLQRGKQCWAWEIKFNKLIFWAFWRWSEWRQEMMVVVVNWMGWKMRELKRMWRKGLMVKISSSCSSKNKAWISSNKSNNKNNKRRRKTLRKISNLRIKVLIWYYWRIKANMMETEGVVIQIETKMVECFDYIS